jgi:type III pantothenate kinase
MSERRLIAVDVGNSSTKVGWFGDVAAAIDCEPRELPAVTGGFDFATGQSPPDSAARLLPAERCDWHIASVHREGTRILSAWIDQQRPGDTIRVLTHHDLPLSVRADFPDRVGLDRLAAAVAANVIRKAGRPAIVIDAGSAVTVDLVGADGAFEGGVILPGFRMSAEALFGQADQLPLALLAPNDQPPPVLGKNTEGAIRSGLFWGAVGAVREIVEQLRGQLDPKPQVFVTGGDLRRLTEQLGGEARYVPNMVLAGIAIAAAGHPPGKSPA